MLASVVTTDALAPARAAGTVTMNSVRPFTWPVFGSNQRPAMGVNRNGSSRADTTIETSKKGAAISKMIFLEVI